MIACFYRWPCSHRAHHLALSPTLLQGAPLMQGALRQEAVYLRHGMGEQGRDVQGARPVHGEVAQAHHLPGAAHHWLAEQEGDAS